MLGNVRNATREPRVSGSGLLARTALGLVLARDAGLGYWQLVDRRTPQWMIGKRVCVIGVQARWDSDVVIVDRITPC